MGDGVICDALEFGYLAGIDGCSCVLGKDELDRIENDEEQEPYDNESLNIAFAVLDRARHGHLL